MSNDMLTHVEQAQKRLPGRVLYSSISGSHLYGVANAASDIDWKFIYCLSREKLLGLDPPTVKKMTSEGKFEEPGSKFEWVGHDVGKFCQLLLKGNPTMVEMLFSHVAFAKHHSYHVDTWADLTKRRKKFLSKKVVKQYLGYIEGQLKRLESKLALHTKGGEWNTKWAYHMLRLSWDLLKIIDGKEPAVLHLGDHRDELLAVRRGDREPKDITNQIKNYITTIEAAKPWDPLPDEGPREWLNSWLLRVRGSHYGY